MKTQRLLFWQVAPERWQKNRIDWAKHRSISPLQDFQSHSLLATFLLLGSKSCHGTCPIHHRLFSPCNWAESVTQLLGKCSAVTAPFYFCLCVHFGHCIRSFLVQSNDSISTPAADIPSRTKYNRHTAFKYFTFGKAVFWNNPVVSLRCFNTCLYLCLKGRNQHFSCGWW